MQTMMRIDVREATRADIAAIVRVINRAYRVEDFFVIGDRTDDAEIGKKMDAGIRFLVIEGDAGDVAATVYVELRGERGYFGMLAVDPAYQRRGAARRLVGAVEDLCRTAGCRHLDLDTVDLREELPPFYGALGFVPVGTAPFPEPDKLRRPAHVIVMSKPL